MSERAILRPATVADLDALEALETSAFHSDRLSRRSLRYYAHIPTALFLVMEVGGALIGDAIVAFRRDSRVARLYSIAVDPQRVGHGYGQCLLATCEQAVRERGRTLLRLEVRDDNVAAIHLYGRSGYRQFGRIPDFYEDGATALRFEKSIAPLGRIGGLAED